MVATANQHWIFTRGQIHHVARTLIVNCRQLCVAGHKDGTTALLQHGSTLPLDRHKDWWVMKTFCGPVQALSLTLLKAQRALTSLNCSEHPHLPLFNGPGALLKLRWTWEVACSLLASAKCWAVTWSCCIALAQVLQTCAGGVGSTFGSSLSPANLAVGIPSRAGFKLHKNCVVLV